LVAEHPKAQNDWFGCSIQSSSADELWHCSFTMDIKDFSWWPVGLVAPDRMLQIHPLTPRIWILKRRFHFGPESA